MNRFLKVVLYSAAAAGAALLGWRFVRASTLAQEVRDPSANGDFKAEAQGAAGELTEGQREKLLEELEEQLGA